VRDFLTNSCDTYTSAQTFSFGNSRATIDELLNLAGWRAGHKDYFERNGGFSPDMELVCERFRLVETLGNERVQS
jgi:uncharacterized protein YhfF